MCTLFEVEWQKMCYTQAWRAEPSRVKPATAQHHDVVCDRLGLPLRSIDGAQLRLIKILHSSCYWSNAWLLHIMVVVPSVTDNVARVYGVQVYFSVFWHYKKGGSYLFSVLLSLFNFPILELSYLVLYPFSLLLQPSNFLVSQVLCAYGDLGEQAYRADIRCASRNNLHCENYMDGEWSNF